ncbi:MAG TPA: AI-2E family transporter [Candidatus Paceibacterota bacterium]|jgi:predicted PurR-regulated permease PerM
MQTQKIQGYFLFGLLAAVSILTFFIFSPFLTPLALAAIFAVVLYPLQRFFISRFNGWPGLGSLLTILIATICLLVPISLIALQVIGEAKHTYMSLTQGAGLVNTQGTIIYIGSALEPHAPGASAVAADVAADLNSYVAGGLEWLLAHLGTAFSSLLGVALDLFIFFVALYVFLKHGPSIRQSLLRLSPFNDEDDTRIFDRLALTINSVVRGSLAVALVQGIVASLGFIIFGVPNPLLWGLITSIAALVPGVGTALVLAPAILFLVVSGETVSALGLLAWGIAAVGLVDNFLGPMLMGRGIHMPSLVVLLSVLGGLAFFGGAGIFLGPLTVSLLLALFSLYADAEKRRTA